MTPITTPPAADPVELTPEQAAVLAGCSVWTVLRWVREGRIRGRRDYRGRVRVRTDSLRALIGNPEPEK